MSQSLTAVAIRFGWHSDFRGNHQGFGGWVRRVASIAWAIDPTLRNLRFACQISRRRSYILGEEECDDDIVEGPMANDTIFNYVQDFVDGKISRAAFWELAKFKHPTHQICFNTQRALTTLKFSRDYTVTDDGR